MDNGARVTMDHIRRLKLCARGARAWAERHGFDWPELLRDGWSADAMEATGDHFAIQLAELARTESRA